MKILTHFVTCRAARIFILAVIGTALAYGAIGCKKHVAAPVAAQNVTDLGTIDFTGGAPVQRDLGNGKSCQLSITSQPNGSTVLQVMVMDAGQMVASPRRFIQDGVSVTFSIGDMNYSLTPKLK